MQRALKKNNIGLGLGVLRRKQLLNVAILLRAIPVLELGFGDGIGEKFLLPNKIAIYANVSASKPHLVPSATSKSK